MKRSVSGFWAAMLLAGVFVGHAAVGMDPGQKQTTTTPVKHLVIIFGENISFDHYFGTYPNALNPPGSSRFTALPGTPGVNGLTPPLLLRNPNFLNIQVNRQYAANPFRLDRSQAATADQNHGYNAEQLAFHAGLMDSFPQFTGLPGTPAQIALAARIPSAPPQYLQQNKALVMGYFDGNTVTAMWNYAQRYALSDNSYAATFGESTQGAIELVAGQTNGVTDQINAAALVVGGGNGTYTEIADGDPIGDTCSNTVFGMLRYTGNNIGAMLSRHSVTWGWFEGGFDLTKKNPNGTTGCLRTTWSPVTQISVPDYIPHHEPFQYYEQTANLNHLRPSSISAIGKDSDRARHQYDIDDFFAAVQAENFPAVSFLKAPGFQDGHAGYSDPLDEQAFVVKVLNFLERRPEWKNTAVILAYDDSDGWYDHQMGPIVNQSSSPVDALTGPGRCGEGSTALPGPNVGHAQGRCGFGPRLPLLVISPFAKRNYVDHTLTDQTSILRFIEDNWLNGERVGQGSFDAISGSLLGMFDFQHPDAKRYILKDSTGAVVEK